MDLEQTEVLPNLLKGLWFLLKQALSDSAWPGIIYVDQVGLKLTATEW